jgi:OOP family OmpA-OmpF porin
MKKLIFALTASAAVATAHAQTTGRPYAGLGVATANHNYSLAGAGATNIDNDGWKASAKVFGGFEFTQNLGVEVGYTDFRSSGFRYTHKGQSVSGDADGYGAYLAAKYTVPLKDQFSAYGKLGVAYSKRKLNANDGTHIDNDDTGVYAGVGVEYKLNEKVAFVGEYERYGKSKDFGAKPDVISFGVKYSF